MTSEARIVPMRAAIDARALCTGITDLEHEVSVRASHRGDPPDFERPPSRETGADIFDRVLPQASTALRERESELHTIDAALARAAASEGGLLLVEGPAGIGKTELLRAAARLAPRRGLAVLRSTAVELERDSPFGVVRHHLEAAVRQAPQTAPAAFQGAAYRAAPLAGLGYQTGPRPPETPAFAMLHALFWAYLNLADQQPLLVCVDDLQWADAPSLRLLAYLGRRLEGAPLTLLVSRREEQGRTERRLLGEIAGAARDVLRPSLLSEGAVGSAIAAGVGRRPDAVFVSRCHDLSGGNPFLVEELIRTLQSEQVEPVAAQVSHLDQLVPRNARRVLERRLEQVGPDASKVARAVAVLAPGADHDRVASLSGLSGDRLQEALEGLVEAGVLAADTAPATRHPLIRNAVYQSMPAGEAERLHAHAATVLCREGQEAELVAGHLLMSEAIGEKWAVRALRDAAAGALSRGAPEVAAAYLRRLLREPLADGQRAGVLLDAGTAAFQAGDGRAEQDLRGALRLAGEPAERALAALMLSAALTAAGSVAEAVELLEEMVSSLGAKSARLVAVLEGALLAVSQLDAHAGPPPTQRFWRLKAEIDRGADLPANAFATVAVHAAFRNEHSSVVEDLAERALALEEADDDPLAAVAPSFFHACAALVAADRFDRAGALYDDAVGSATESGDSVQLCLAYCWRSLLRLRLGTILEAEADASMVLSRDAGSFERLFRPLAAAVLIDVLGERGRLGEAEAVVAMTDAWADDRSIYSALLGCAIGRVQHLSGQHSAAAARLLEAGDQLLSLGATSPSIAAWRSEAALALAAAGHHDRARELAAEEVVLARAFGAPRALGVALQAAGLLEIDRSAGSRMLAEACAVLEASPARLAHAKALTAFGAALRRRRRRSEAREHLRRGLDLGTRLGATRLRRQAHTELLAAGARPRSLVLSGIEALTASERRVAELAAGGATNRLIAQTLFVTPRTVEGHLTHVYRKLNVEGRRELSGALGRDIADGEPPSLTRPPRP